MAAESSSSSLLNDISTSADDTRPLSRALSRQVKHARAILPKASNGETQNGEKVSKRKQSKSRNGCVTCKAKRMKCDETKPSCQQCARRGITCGGYRQDLKWKPFIEPKHARRQLEEIRPFEECSDAPPQSTKPSLSLVLNDRIAGDTANDSAISPVHRPDTTAPLLRPSSRPGSPSTNAPSSQSISDLAQLTTVQLEAAEFAITTSSAGPVFTASDSRDFDTTQSAITEPSSYPSIQSPKLVDLDELLLEIDMDAAFHNHQSPQLGGSLSPCNGTTTTTQAQLDSYTDGSNAVYETCGPDYPPGTVQQEDPSIETWLDLPLSDSCLSDGLDLYPFYKQPQLPGGSSEMIALLFDRQTCGILSIKDEPTENPWRTLIWPLARNYPALYHAVAAMTCLHMCKMQMQLRIQGIRHMQCSMQALAVDMESGNMRIEVALAATLALGFAESWDHQKSSTGIDHIKAAKTLVQQALSKHRASRLPASELHLLSFLANTWIYMDVIARLTSADNDTASNFDFMTACYFLDPARELQIDPLMGCAVTLFPTIGRVAALVNRIRRRSADRNSPAIISEAIELKKAIEHWAPSIDLEASEDPTSNISDCVQTAEAYRWATLLLLRQAVPEMPSLKSWWEIAQKVLLFLATVPLTSHTTIVQIFPLMVAGCEALEEDRGWVRERWESMSRRMITGIVDRCIEVTAEVWKRRDEYEVHCGACHISCDAPQSSSSTVPKDGSGVYTDVSTHFDTLATLQNGFDLAPTRPRNVNIVCRCGSRAPTRPGSSDFPDSVAFKKGADTITRAGYIDYTVKGKLHWLGVMQDWKWEVMLG